ncbi:unnamed protein product [Boreogadus saida]
MEGGTLDSRRDYCTASHRPAGGGSLCKVPQAARNWLPTRCRSSFTTLCIFGGLLSLFRVAFLERSRPKKDGAPDGDCLASHAPADEETPINPYEQQHHRFILGDVQDSPRRSPD